MDKNIIASMIDHAVLRPDATDDELKRECAVAIEYKVATVCVKPSHVREARKLLEGTGVGVSTVIGFPHGSTTTACKAAEAAEAVENGASELDMVINIGKLLSGDLQYVKDDIGKVARTAHAGGALLKVIIETSLLNDTQKALVCRLAEEEGADFVKTSTGFNGGGAAIKDINIMKSSVSEKMGIKASGGIKTFEQGEELVKAGCTRLGTSATEKILGNR